MSSVIVLWAEWGFVRGCPFASDNPYSSAPNLHVPGESALMWQHNTQLHTDLVNIIEQALSINQPEAEDVTVKLEQKLRLYPAADGFAAALDTRVATKLFPVNTGQTFNTWIEGIDTWLNEVQDPRSTPSTASSILYILWDRFASDLSDNLRRARIVAAVPIDGYVLAFVSCLSKCIVVHYRFHGLIPKLEPKVVIDSPRSAFDIWDAIDTADQASKNYLKRVLTSGHKLVSHRGILVHVDRRNEARVFGPSIDTILVSEELARCLYEQFSSALTGKPQGPTRVLEIGTGSGFLSAGIVRYLASLENLICVDVESTAIFCTEKNIKVALLSPGTLQPHITYLIGAFDAPKFYNQKLDLIICNPPYIPYPSNWESLNKKSAYYLEAIGGLELIYEVLHELPKVLAPNGKLLLIVSNLSLDETLKAVPEGYKVSRPLGEGGIEVLFDVEDVLENGEWNNFLQAKEYGKLYRHKGEFVHRLHPLWITKD
jgi:methylase of polypeptide subunit release factors